MSARTKLNLILGCVLAILSGLLLLTGPKKTAITRLPLEMTAHSLSSITIEPAPTTPTTPPGSANGGAKGDRVDRVRLERRADEWWLVQPFEHPANPITIARLLGLLDTPAREVPISQSAKGESVDVLGPFGLGDPQQRLWLDDLQVDFGDRSPLGTQRYVHILGRVFVIDDRFQRVLRSPVYDFCAAALPVASQSLTSASVRDIRSGLITRLERAQLLDLESALQASSISTVGPAGEVQARALAVLSLESNVPSMPGSIELTLRSTGQSLVLERRSPPLAYHLTASAGQDLIDRLNRLFFNEAGANIDSGATAR